MTRRTDNRTTRLPVPASELPAFEPVPIKPRHDGWTPERQRAFIEALADTGSVAAACRHVNMTTVGAYRIRRLPGAAGFSAAWTAALDLGVQRLEDVAMERALNGVEEPFYVYGQHVGTRTRYNDRLLMFMLRNRNPERYGASANGASLKGLNAIGKMEKRRLKKKWRKQWEAERKNVSAADVRASIDRKVARFREQVDAEKARHFARLSPETRRAYELYLKLRERDEAKLQAEASAAREATRSKENTSFLTPEDVRPRKPEPEPETFPKWHKLTDDGWR